MKKRYDIKDYITYKLSFEIDGFKQRVEIAGKRMEVEMEIRSIEMLEDKYSEFEPQETSSLKLFNKIMSSPINDDNDSNDDKVEDEFK